MPKFLIRADEPFRGHAQSVLKADGTVAYTNGLSVEQYEQEHGFKVKVVSEEEMFDLVKAHEETLKTEPQTISEDRFLEMLNILPPQRWHNAGGFEVFHISEPLSGDLVAWFAHRGSRYWEFTDSRYLKDSDLAAKLRGLSC